MKKNLRVAFLAWIALATVAQAQDSKEDASPPELEKTSLTLEAPASAEGACTAPAPGRIWGSVDLLSAWVRGMRLPPLVTTSPQGTPANIAGVFDSPSTSILFGDQRVNTEGRIGVRLALGRWFDFEQTRGIEIGYSVLEALNSPFSAASDGNPILDRPTFNAANGTPNGLLLAFPGTVSGAVKVMATSSNFHSLNVSFRELFASGPRYRLDSILGYRMLRLDERLSIVDSFAPTGPAIIPGTVIENSDFFQTRNEFHGCEFGIRAEIYFPRASVELLGKLAMGSLHRDVSISGQSRFNVPGSDPADFTAGLLAQSTNNGVRGSNDWVVAPEVGINLNYEIAANLKFRLGYSFLLLPSVARPGDQIDLTLNQPLLPGGIPAGGDQRPAFILNRTDVWIHTFNAGLMFTY